jgi:hypothetical protein
VAKGPRHWRVSPDNAPHPFVVLGKDAAYERAREYADRGEGITLERLKNGEWLLFERINPVADPDAEV